MIIKTNGNELYLYGTIWGGDGTWFLDVFSQLDGKYPTIDVHLHCNGGSVFDGNLIYNTILSAKSEINGYVDGIAASMAGVLLLAFKKVYMVENGFVMLHAPSGYTQGDAKQHESNAKLLRSIEKNFLKKLIARTGKTETEVQEWMVGDNWFDAQQALEAKLIDEIIEPVTTVDIGDPTAQNVDDVFNSFAALMVASPSGNKKDFKTSIEMKQELINKYGLQGVNAQSSDTAVIEALENHIANKTATIQASLDAKTREFTTLETAVNAQREAQIKSLLDTAEAQGKYPKAQRETYESIGKTSGVQALETVLQGLGVRQSVEGKIVPKNGVNSVTAREGWDWDKYQKEAPREIEALAQNDPDAFNALYEAKYGKPFNK